MVSTLFYFIWFYFILGLWFSFIVILKIATKESQQACRLASSFYKLCVCVCVCLCVFVCVCEEGGSWCMYLCVQMCLCFGCMDIEWLLGGIWGDGEASRNFSRGRKRRLARMEVCREERK